MIFWVKEQERVKRKYSFWHKAPIRHNEKIFHVGVRVHYKKCINDGLRNYYNSFLKFPKQ